MTTRPPPYAAVKARLLALRGRIADDPRWMLILGVYVTVCVVTFDQIDEDAFIYFRVAANIGEGYGYVYNRGGERIESGSSIVWQYLLALVHFLGLDVVVFSKLLGVLAGGLALYVVWRLSLKVVSDPAVAAFPAVLLAITYPFYCGATRGIETSIYGLTVVSLAYCLVDERLKAYWFVAAAMLALTRSEGFIGLFGLGGFFYFERRHLGEHAVRLAAALAIIAGTYVWRFFYFHDLVPHAFYLKIHGSDSIGHVAAWLFLRKTNLWIPLGIAAVGLASRRAWDRTTVVLAAYSAPFLYWGLTFQAGMAQYNRHLLPALCVGYPIAGRGFDVVVARWRRLAPALLTVLAAYTTWLVIGSDAMRAGFTVVDNPFKAGLKDLLFEPRWVARNFGALVANRPRAKLTADDMQSQRITSTWMYLFGDFIRQRYPKGITVVFDQAGQTPWYAGLDKTFIDPFGLANRAAGYASFNHWLDVNRDVRLEAYRTVAQVLLRPWHEPARGWDYERAADYVFDLHPHLIILFSVPEKIPEGKVAHSSLSDALASDPRLTSEYVDRPKWYMHWYHRRDIVPLVQWAKGENEIPGTFDTAPVHYH